MLKKINIFGPNLSHFKSRIVRDTKNSFGLTKFLKLVFKIKIIFSNMHNQNFRLELWKESRLQFNRLKMQKKKQC